MSVEQVENSVEEDIENEDEEYIKDNFCVSKKFLLVLLFSLRFLQVSLLMLFLF